MSFDLNLRDVGIAYGERVVCQYLNLPLKANTCTCLLGPSGVGKSSLLNMIAGIETHFTGEISASDGQALTGRVMMMTQNDGLLPWLDILSNVLIGFRLRGNVDEAIILRAKKLLLKVGLLEPDWAKKPKALSGGMRQRVALVRTVLEDKPLWLMDEPFSALDAINRYKIQTLLAELWQNKTILLVTHDPLEALRLGDEIYVLSGQPANVEKVMISKTSMPRELTPDILQSQAHILHLLAKGVS